MKNLEKKEECCRKRSIQEKKYWNWKETLPVFLFLCFLLGILVANRIDPQMFHNFSFWRIKIFQGGNMDRTELFYYIAMKRIPAIFILFFLLIFTDFGKTAGVLFFSWQGFSAGFLLAVSVIVHGIKGILWVLASIFPHYFIYIPLYIIYLPMADFFTDKRESRRKDYRRTVKMFSICFLLICIYTLGIFLESYINPYILEFFPKNYT